MSARRLTLLLALATVVTAVAPAVASAAAPAGVTGMALDARVELSWQPAAGATAYKVYRGTTATTVTTPLMASPLVPPDLNVPASFTDITAVNGTTYYYSVRAIIGGVESADSRLVKATPRARTCTGANVVVQENCLPGTDEWKVRTSDTSIDGYATEQSIDRGGSLDLKISAPGASRVDVEIFRSGWYGGLGGRLFATIPDVPVSTQPACSNDTTLGLYDCSSWSVTQTLTTTANWPSGAYLVRIRRTDTGDESHILFVVRDDTRRADVLYGIPFSTYQAYNDFGGKSLYESHSTGANTVAGTPRAVKVSFDRPYRQPHDSVQHDWYPRSDFPMVAWLERSGYDVSYASVSELERSGARVLDHRIYISGAHDEYWSSAMRTSLETARDRGVDLFFTGANEIFWRVRFEPSTVTGRQDRVMVCYKTTQGGVADPSGIPTTTWRDPAGANKPENALAGGQFVGQAPFDYFPLRVSSAEGKDRIWRNTGLENQPAGTSTNIGTSILGWEWDARATNGQEPPGVTTLASSPGTGQIAQGAGGTFVNGNATSNVTKYTWSSGSLVFSTGTNHWNWGLATTDKNEGEPNSRIQQATTNVLADMGALPETPASGIVLDDPSAPPAVVAKSPASGATNVDIGAKVKVTFSRAMNGSTFTGSSFTLTRSDGTAVPATVAYDDITFIATLTPNAPLNLDTSYTVRLDGSIRAANGIALGSAQTWSFRSRPPDTTPPAVSVTAPAAGSTVLGVVNVTGDAVDDVAVASVQFKVDGNDLGTADTTAPYSTSWDVRTFSAGNHTLTAVARDTSGNSTTSAPVTVVVDPTGLVAAYGFEETTGTGATDSSGKNNPGTLNGPTRTTSGKFGRALTFDGVNDQVNVADSASLDLTNALTLEAWVNPSALGTAWRTVLMKEQPSATVYALYGNTDTTRPSANFFTTSEQDVRGTAALGLNTWSHLAATYDGSVARLYVNGTQVATKALNAPLVTSTGALRIGGNNIWGEWFAGTIDEVRVYRRVLTAAEIQADMTAAVIPAVQDSVPPSAPSNLVATGAIGRASLTWTAATDNVGVDLYNVHRGATPGFTPTAANRVAQVSGTSFTDAGLGAGDYYYRVTAQDIQGNVGPVSNEAHAVVTADTAPPTVSVTAPAGGATVSGIVTISATAGDNVGVVGVQFKRGTTDLGSEDTSSPYSTSWDTSGVANGSYTLTAVARDAAGNSTTSAPVTVTVSNAPPDPSGLVAAYGFEEASGSSVADGSNNSNTGTITGATRTASGRFGSALTFNGTSDWVTVPDASSLDLTNAMTLEAWVRPAAVTGWRTVLMKEQTNGLVYSLYANTDTNRPSAHVNPGNEVDTRGTAQLAVNTWAHLAATYDGANLRLYVNGTLASTHAVTGNMVNSTGALRMGGNQPWGEWFSGQIDEVRVYRRALSASEIASDMSTPVNPAAIDSVPPSAPGALTATGGLGQAQLSWGAATDNIGVVRYDVHRSSTAGFTPSAANRVAQVTGTSYTDTGMAAGAWYYRVIAVDAAGNTGPASNEATATVTADTTAPTVSLTAPANGATVSGAVTVSASASDNVGIAGVQFKRGTTNIGSEDTSSPYSVSWDTTALANGSYTLTAVARDAAGNSTTSAPITVTVSNTAPDPGSPVAAYGFEEASGSTVTDSSNNGNTGTITGAVRTTAGRFGSALTFNGTSDWVTIADAASLDVTNQMTLEAWVRPSAVTSWRTVLMKEQTNGLVYGLYANSDTNRPSVHVNSAGEKDTRGTAQLAVNTWTHLAATYDGANLRLYVNGVQASSKADTGNLPNSTGALRIGGNSVWSEWFAGQIDEVRVYTRALTAAEITTDMNKAVVGP
jgi:hypothetical protein